MNQNPILDRQVGSVTDKTVKLSCGCLAIFMRGDLDRGRMFFCNRHLQLDVFDGLKMLNEISLQIKQGATKIELGAF